MHAHGEKFTARHVAVRVEEILPANLPADAHALLGEQHGGIFLRPPGHVTVGDVRLLLLDGDDHGRLLRLSAAAVGGAKAEVVAPALAVGRGVNERAVVGERHRALDGLGRDAEGEGAAVGRAGAQRTADGRVAERGQLQILRHRCGGLRFLSGVDGRTQCRAERKGAYGCEQFLLHHAKPPCKCR